MKTQEVVKPEFFMLDLRKGEWHTMGNVIEKEAQS